MGLPVSFPHLRQNENYRIENSPLRNCPWRFSRDDRLLQAMSASAKQLIKSNFSAVFVSVIRPRYQLFKHPFGNKLEWNFTKENVPVKINEKDHSRPRKNSVAHSSKEQRQKCLFLLSVSFYFQSGNHWKKQGPRNWQIWICCFIKANCRTIWIQNSFSFTLSK